MSMDAFEAKLAAYEAELTAAGPVVIPEWVVDPVDREMIRRGRARLVPTVSPELAATDGWIAGDGPDCDGWEVRDNGRTEADRLLDEMTRREIADQIEAERKAKANKKRGEKKMSARLDSAMTLVEGHVKLTGASRSRACELIADRLNKASVENGERVAPISADTLKDRFKPSKRKLGRR